MSTAPQTKEIWDILKETQKNIRELSISQKKTDEGLKKAKGLFETQWGKLMESLVEGDLVKILNERGIAVKNTYMNVKSKFGEDQYEYDIVAGNGAETVVVEVKTTLRIKHVKRFLEDIKKFRGRLSVSKNKTIYGAVAYLRVEEEAEKFAEKHGLFVVRATGDSASIINKKDFKPKVFS